MQWHYAVKGQQFGPVEQEQLLALIREGKVGASDLVWNPGMGSQWAKVADVPALKEGAPAGAGTVPPPPAAGWTEGASCASRTSNRDLMAQARACLTGNWGLGVGVVVLMQVIGIVASLLPLIGWMISMLIGGPLTLGLAMVFLAIARTEGASVGMLFDGFKRFGTAFATYLLSAIFVMLWMLLLIIPGLIAALSYSMAYFILQDDPNVGAMEAIDRSKKMMRGNKWKYFCLQWRFFGWALLCLLTFGIGFLWLAPYMMTSTACFYEDLKKGQQAA